MILRHKDILLRKLVAPTSPGFIFYIRYGVHSGKSPGLLYNTQIALNILSNGGIDTNHHVYLHQRHKEGMNERGLLKEEAYY